MSVSYTHLDVYKRQGYGVALAVEEAVGEFGSGPGDTSTMAKTEEFLRQAGTYLASARPDVYKRQGS